MTTKIINLKRKKVIQCHFTKEEHEYVTRYCFSKGVSCSNYGRNKMLPAKWKAELLQLRAEQNDCDITALDGRHTK